MNKKSKVWMLIGIIAFVGLLLVAVVALNNKESGPKVDKDGEDVNQTVLNTLPEKSWEIQNNTITDTWGVVLRSEQLPKALQNATGYTITIDGATYELTENKFDNTVFNGQVPSSEHTEEEVAVGFIEKVE